MTRKKFIPASIASLWFVTPILLWLILKRNTDHGVYGPSDAILIPFLGSVYFCAIGIPYLLFFTLGAMNRCARVRKPWEFTSSIRQWLILLLFGFGAFLLALQVIAWLDLEHFPIAICYALALAWLIWIRPYASQKRFP